MHHERDPEAINSETKPEIGYEYRDISVKGLIVSTVWFFGGSTVVIALAYLFFVLAVDLPIRPATPPETVPQYPNPLIQGTAAVKADIASLRKQEEQKLHGSGWVDEKSGVAHIPIEEAMKKLAEQGEVK
jgi:hypothetical protein